MITGGVKTTPVLAMQLLCDLQPFTNIIEKNAAILFNRLIRLPNNSFWRDYDSDGGRNLKTQKGFIQCVRENSQYKVIKDVPFELLSFANPLDYAILDIRLDLVLNVRKRDLSPTALHAIALETINTRFPPEEWLHIYTDGSLLDFAQDSTSALQALSNYNENNCLRVQNCRELLGKIKGKIVFQWVPSHCGLWGNERADFLAKKGTGILQNFRRDLTLHSAKLEIKRIFRESFRLTASRVARDKPWSTLCKKSHGIPSSPRAAAVAKFRLLTGHDCLCAHLFRFNLVTSPICVLCDTGQDMTAAHLDECSALNDLNCIAVVSNSKAARVVESFPATADNYPKAIAQLQERFGSEDLLVQIYVRYLLSMVMRNAATGRSKTDLPALYDELEAKIQALESLGRTQDKYGKFLSPLVESCLPEDMLLAFESSKNFKEDSPGKGQTLKLLMNFLKQEVKNE
ncbi:uncharacterized protein LOC103524116 [Trichonephila clavipes]|uniref:Uncharacterized protein LOC103524116 n=1 Tax=Trichonephila clavipes TaxID=2585209 RepID=A0A8X6SXX0_TRICX|nr:uncharacterized protein LOC103524116 [Trichonephila clavipes]